MQATVREPSEEPLREGQGDSQQGEQRPGGEAYLAFALIVVYSVFNKNVLNLDKDKHNYCTIPTLDPGFGCCFVPFEFVLRCCEIVG
jgi:hypothetical protein